MRLTQPSSVNVLINSANWDWPEAVARIFRPSGINALVAQSFNETLRLVTNNRIHLAIFDISNENLISPNTKPVTTEQILNTIRSIRTRDHLLPLILITDSASSRILGQALSLGAFCVIAKPVDIGILSQQVHRLFSKLYGFNLSDN
jgi:DNA-binding NtrC family response regulator